MAKKRIDPKAKAKKQKIYAAVGGVLLLGLLAFQVPRTLKMMNPPVEESAPATTPSATTPSTSGPLAAPSLSGGNATTAAVTGGDGLTDPDVVPAPQSGQLLAFGLFRTKDPFVQQLKSTCVAAGATSTTGCSTAPASGATGAGGATGGNTPASTVPQRPSHGSGSTPAAPPVAAKPTAAVILVNGSSETVQSGANFPAVDPIFTLVSLTKLTAKVAIAGGSLESGSAAVTLKKNKPVTLLNTADGTRYVLRLVSIS